MGFKTQNYEINGCIYPEVYAVYEITDTTVQPVVASFKVHTSRENALYREPLERKYARFPWDRKSNLVEMAYDVAKSKTINIYDPVTGNIIDTVAQVGIFDNWEDDIQGDK